jgi:hypothetical protein
MVGIYKITNPVGKIYIGQSRNIDERLSTYKRYHCKNQIKLYNSLIKYKFENHKFEIISELPSDIDQNILDIYENFYYNQYVFCNFKMLNLKEPGPSGKLLEEVKHKISNSLKADKHPQYKKQRSIETRIKISKSTSGIKSKDYGKTSINKGKTQSTESNEKRRNSLLGKLKFHKIQVKHVESNIIFESVTKASIHFNVTKRTIKNWNNLGLVEYMYK